MAVEIVHTGDTHLGYRQYRKQERERDFINAFKQVIDYAVNHSVDAVVHSGDLFHDSNPGVGGLSECVSELQRLVDADIPFFIIVGNHEISRDTQWASFFEDVGLATRLGREGHRIGDVSFFGLDYTPETKREQLSYRFEQPEGDTRYNVLVAHGLFSPLPVPTSWDIHDVLGQANVDFDTILAGDYHDPVDFEIAQRDCYLTYSGSTERTAADQREERTFQVVSFDNDKIAYDRIPIDTRPFVYIDVDMGSGGDISLPRGASEEASSLPVVEKVQSRLHEKGELLEECVVVVTIDGNEASHKLPTKPIEEVGYEYGALKVLVSDWRDIDQEERDSRDVSFADPETQILSRRKEIPLSEPAVELEELVRDTSEPKSTLSDTAQAHVEEQLENSLPELLAVSSEEPDGDGAVPLDDTEEDSPQFASDDESVITVEDVRDGGSDAEEPTTAVQDKSSVGEGVIEEGREEESNPSANNGKQQETDGEHMDRGQGQDESHSSGGTTWKDDTEDLTEGGSSGQVVEDASHLVDGGDQSQSGGGAGESEEGEDSENAVQQTLGGDEV